MHFTKELLQMKILLKVSLVPILCIILVSCSYTSENAIQLGDIVDLHGNVSNIERLDEFVSNVNSVRKDEVRITRYTTEGDPIFYDLKFDGDTITYTYDPTQDSFGRGKKISTTCMVIIRNEGDDLVEYTLDNCFGENEELGNNFRFGVNKEKDV
jgi:hypothetical protein